ncbi:MAG: DoxX family protein [Xenococcaceae cyanobacterium]
MNSKLADSNLPTNYPRLNKYEFFLRIGLGVFLLGAGVSEISQNPVVMISIQKLGYPDYLARLLGVAKIVGVLVLLTPSLKRWREWAYAGFTFNLLGACLSFILAKEWIIPDSILAPIVLLLLCISYWLYRQCFPYSKDFVDN